MNRKRYTSGRKRTELIAFYVTKEEKEFIESIARKEDRSISDYCRKTLVKSENTLCGRQEERN